MIRFSTLEDLIDAFAKENWDEDLICTANRRIPDSKKLEAFDEYVRKRLVRMPEHGKDWVLPGFGHAPSYSNTSVLGRLRSIF